MKNKIKKILLYGQMKQNKTLRLQKSQKQKMQLWKKKLLIRQMIKQKIQI